MNKEPFSEVGFYGKLCENAMLVYSRQEWDEHIVKVLSNINMYAPIDLMLLSLGIAHDLVEDYKEKGMKCIDDSFSFFSLSPEAKYDKVDFCQRVLLLTRDSNEGYFDYINRIIKSKDESALIVKLCDLEANIARATEDGSRLQKYLFAHEKIWGALKEIECKKRIKNILKI